MSLTVKTGQNFRCGFFDVPAKERLSAIKEAGFDETMFWWGTEFEETDGSRLQLFDLAIKQGLEVNTCHFPTTHADWLWYDDEKALSYVNQFATACNECGERNIKNLVIHTTRKLITPEPNTYGIDNLKRMLDSAHKNNIVIAIENTRFLRYNDYIINNIQDDAIGFCFDSGHANCYTPTENPLERYGCMLVTTHLHDNVGPNPNEADQHRLMGEGTVDFDKVFAGLKIFRAKHYNLESYCDKPSEFYGKLSLNEFLQLSHKRLTAQLKKSGII